MKYYTVERVNNPYSKVLSAFITPSGHLIYSNIDFYKVFGTGDSLMVHIKSGTSDDTLEVSVGDNAHAEETYFKAKLKGN